MALAGFVFEEGEFGGAGVGAGEGVEAALSHDIAPKAEGLDLKGFAFEFVLHATGVLFFEVPLRRRLGFFNAHREEGEGEEAEGG